MSCKFPSTFIISKTLLVDPFGFSIYVMSSVKSDNFTSSFPIWMPFVSLFCLVSLARTASKTLDNSSESEHPCLVPELRVKAFRFLPLSLKLAEGLS